MTGTTAPGFPDVTVWYDSDCPLRVREINLTRRRARQMLENRAVPHV
jgi:predicted DCC family thiol-disulfide oxidoreductase YuxK